VLIASSVLRKDSPKGVATLLFAERVRIDGGAGRQVRLKEREMIELTKDRLEEARFFLSKLLQHEAAQVQPRKPAWPTAPGQRRCR
jgi:hypothetical protein